MRGDRRIDALPELVANLAGWLTFQVELRDDPVWHEGIRQQASYVTHAFGDPRAGQLPARLHVNDQVNAVGLLHGEIAHDFATHGAGHRERLSPEPRCERIDLQILRERRFQATLAGDSSAVLAGGDKHDARVGNALAHRADALQDAGSVGSSMEAFSNGPEIRRCSGRPYCNFRWICHG
ncbi:hypothetical protein ED208_05100 [Stagnimonas aquatica]|uniref:Uncharacterized protein n=1 Tax=Stagnimonas aquatica TaxID=2689987 RepID=A0A3N0VGF4_9GAMM|nr:hypothetical protein ED208_05100 [Stagnimonas aquatica]